MSFPSIKVSFSFVLCNVTFSGFGAQNFVYLHSLRLKYQVSGVVYNHVSPDSDQDFHARVFVQASTSSSNNLQQIDMEIKHDYPIYEAHRLHTHHACKTHGPGTRCKPFEQLAIYYKFQPQVDEHACYVKLHAQTLLHSESAICNAAVFPQFKYICFTHHPMFIHSSTKIIHGFDDNFCCLADNFRGVLASLVLYCLQARGGQVEGHSV